MQEAAEAENGRKPVFLGLLSVFLVYFIAYYYIQTIGVARPRIAADLDGMALYSWAISIPGLAAAFVLSLQLIWCGTRVPACAVSRSG